MKDEELEATTMPEIITINGNHKPSANQPRIGILALSIIADDPRVRRQGDAFYKAGWGVVGIGLEGGISSPPDWPVVAIAEQDKAPNTSGFVHNLRNCHLLRRTLLVARVAGAHLSSSFAESAYWRLNTAYQSMLDLARLERVDIWLANDWMMLPIAQTLSKEQGVPYCYDTHELATDEYAQSLRWRLARRPLIKIIEAGGIAQAAHVSCVSPGISRRLADIYALSEAPAVVRNMPIYYDSSVQDHAEREELGETIGVLYHGVIAPGRGIEACIESLGDWRSEFHLTIRGPVSPEYLIQLKLLAERCRVLHRLKIAEPVAMTDLVQQAAEFDIGLFALPGHSLHNQYALPNKFFEYVMAGLALCISDLPDMTQLLKQHDLGVLIPDISPKTIAKTINGLDRSAIARYKRNAQAASLQLNWEQESARLVRDYKALIDRMDEQAG